MAVEIYYIRLQETLSSVDYEKKYGSGMHSNARLVSEIKRRLEEGCPSQDENHPNSRIYFDVLSGNIDPKFCCLACEINYAKSLLR